MTWVLLAPAVAVVVAVAAMWTISARLPRELAELRRSLRRLGAAAVAGDELSRSLGQVSGRASALRREAPRRLRRNRRNRSLPADR